MKLLRIFSAVTCSTAWVGAATLAAPPVQARSVTHHLDIPAQDLGAALKALGDAANEQVLFSAAVVAGLRSARIKGDYSADAALSILLKDTGLTASRTPSGVVLIRPATPPPGPQASLGNEPGGRESSVDYRVHLAQSAASSRVDSADAGARAAAQAAAERSDTRIDEVTVTARKRVEKAIDVPFSVQVVTAEDLARQGAVNFSDYARTVAGVQFQDKGAGRWLITMRGVSTGGDVDTGKESSVGVYFDEVPVSENSSQPDLKLFDIDRIEVLRGPQGTLFGSGSLSGTLRVLPKQPDPTQVQGSVAALASATDHGGFNNSVDGMMNVPLSDSAAVRVVGYRVSNDGFLTNGFSGADNINDELTSGGRVALRVMPVEKLDVTLTGVYQKSEFGAYYEATDHYPSLTLDEAEPEPFIDRYGLASLKATYNFGGALLTSVSSYFDRKRHFQNDIDYFTGLFGVPEAYSPLTYTAKTFTQELRLASQSAANLSWVVGGFFENRHEVAIQTGSAAGEPVPPPADQLFYISRYTQAKQYAGFGELSYRLTPKLSATAGVRASRIDTGNKSVNDGFLFGGLSIKDSGGRNSPVTPRFILSYKPTEAAQVYAQAAEGFRIGGSNPGLPPCVAENGCTVNVKSEFDPDSAWNYEIGTKLDLLGGALSLDADVFYIDWSDIQVNVGRGDGFNGFLNAGSARTQGVELAVNGRLGRHVRLGGQLTYTKGELTALAPGVEAAGFAKIGDALPQIPKISTSVFGEWGGSVAGNTWVYLRGDVQFVDKRYNTFTSLTPRKLDAYTLAGLRLGADHGPYSAALFVKNLTDERAMLSDQAYDGLHDGESYSWRRRNVNSPRTVGLVVSRRF